MTRIARGSAAPLTLVEPTAHNARESPGERSTFYGGTQPAPPVSGRRRKDDTRSGRERSSRRDPSSAALPDALTGIGLKHYRRPTVAPHRLTMLFERDQPLKSCDILQPQS